MNQKFLILIVIFSFFSVQCNKTNKDNTQIDTYLFIEIKAITINIKRIENTNFIPLNKKTIVDYFVISPYSLDDFIKMSWRNGN
jgi:thioredoxin-related protein